MESNHVVTVDTTAAEASMDRLIAKAEKLKALLESCENFAEALESPVLASATEPKTASPQIVYSINMGSMTEILNVDAGVFAEDFNERLREDLPYFLRPRKVETKKEIDLTNSGNYKKPAGEA